MSRPGAGRRKGLQLPPRPLHHRRRSSPDFPGPISISLIFCLMISPGQTSATFPPGLVRLFPVEKRKMVVRVKKRERQAYADVCQSELGHVEICSDFMADLLV